MLQRCMLFLHWINWPVVNLTDTLQFGFGGDVEHLFIDTTDGHRLGAWFIPSDSPIVFLYFHGNAGNRATSHRVEFYKLLSRYGSVLTIDYRGFGDSSSAIPNEQGLNIDALAAFSCLLKRGIDPSKIIITGHSLGTGVATHLASFLTENHRPFGGLVLISPYISLIDAALDYGTIPLLRPFQGTFVESWYRAFAADKFSSISKIGRIKRPILLMHGERDIDIKVRHSEQLFAQIKGRKVEKQVNDDATVYKSSKYWFLKVTYAGHNNMSKFTVVPDIIQSWLYFVPQ
jgi:abhydrolase domain-containing protein 12